MFQEVQRLEVEKRHLMDVLAAHAPSCAKRPRRSGCSVGGGRNDDGYRLPSTADQGSLSSAAAVPPLPSAPFYPRGPSSSSLETEGDSYGNLTFSSDQDDLVTDVRQRHISLESAFLADNEEEDEEEEVKNINDDRKQRRHFKSSCSFVGASSTAGTSSTTTSQETSYFLATKSRCLSYGFQIDNRCVAL